MNFLIVANLSIDSLIEEFQRLVVKKSEKERQPHSYVNPSFDIFSPKYLRCTDGNEYEFLKEIDVEDEKRRLSCCLIEIGR